MEQSMQWPGEKLLEKLWDSIADKGIGNLLKPWQMRREGTAAAEIKRLTMLSEAQAEVDAAAIKSGAKVFLLNGTLTDQTCVPVIVDVLGSDERCAPISLAEAAAISNRTDERESIRRAISASKAVAYAESELAQDAQAPSPQPLSDDWLFRWRDNASSVSSDELQSLWGKVLAGEVKHPGSFSLRTLEFLRNLSREDAVLIEKAAPYVVSDVIFRPENENDKVGELSFSDFLELQDLGILSGVDALGMMNKYSSMQVGNFVQPLKSYGSLILVTHSDEKMTFSLPIYSVTKIGQEVLRLGWKRANESYLHSLAERIKRMNFQTSVGTYIDIGGGMIQPINMKAI